MQLKEFDINLDITSPWSGPNIEVVRGDYGSNIFRISLRSGGQTYPLTDDLDAEIVFAKPDRTTVIQDKDTDVTIADSKIICTLRTNTIAVPGRVWAEVRILKETKVLTTAKFWFIVRNPILLDETVKSSNEYPVLTLLIKDAEESISDANDATQAAIEATNSANTAAQSANTAAGAAQDAAANANSKATLANEKALLAKEMAGLADQKAQATQTAADNANTAASNANDKAILAAEKAALADGKAQEAQSAATAANTAAGLANAAATYANEAADEARDAAQEAWDAKDGIQDELSGQKLKITKVEKDLKDYQQTMALVNVNQEAKQKVDGYGMVSLPHNCAEKGKLAQL